MENIDRIVYLLCQLCLEKLSDEEGIELSEWINSSPDNLKLFEKIRSKRELSLMLSHFESVYEGDREGSIIRMQQKISQKLETFHIPRENLIHRFFLKNWKYALAIASTLLVVLLWRFDNHGIIERQNVEFRNQTLLNPGGNKATLVLNGKTSINLDETKKSIKFDTKSIQYEDGISLSNFNQDNKQSSTYTLFTPISGQYQLQLPDGSIAWLNSSSKIEFPEKFSTTERVVEVDGEVYFSIKKVWNASGTLIPFKVKNKGQLVEVLGTEFLISSYTDTDFLYTTLIHGSVKVSIEGASGEYNELTLRKPGEQANIKGGVISKDVVNLDPLIGWKNNLFYFDNTSLKLGLNQLARWYDFEIVYKGKIPDISLYGEFSRSLPLQKILDILKESQLDFTLVRRGDKNILIVKSN